MSTYEFATSVALHRLCLTIPRIVIWTATLITCSSAVVGDTVTRTETTTTLIASSTTRSDRALHVWSRAIASQVADLATGVAATASRSTVYAQSWAVGLDVTEALAVIALLRCNEDPSVCKSLRSRQM